ncbi:MAG: Uma2 family endonuclease [Chloroflexota bacterium]|nr:Uma2 family endonuclease [Chloroflexota bacterium]
MASRPRLVTVEELLEMPDDGFRYELARGKLRKMAPAGARHGRSAGKVARPLMNHVATNNLGEVYIAEAGFLLASDPDHVRVPDVAFVRRERFEDVGDTEGFFPGPPDLAVEVILPSDRYTEVAEKVEGWLVAGTRMVIVVDPRRRVVSVHLPGKEPVTLHEHETLDGGAVVPGWSMPVADIFA